MALKGRVHLLRLADDHSSTKRSSFLQVCSKGLVLIWALKEVPIRETPTFVKRKRKDSHSARHLLELQGCLGVEVEAEFQFLSLQTRGWLWTKPVTVFTVILLVLLLRDSKEHWFFTWGTLINFTEVTGIWIFMASPSPPSGWHVS